MRLLYTPAGLLAGVMLVGCALLTEGLPSEGSGAAAASSRGSTNPSGAGGGSADSTSAGVGASAACAAGSKCVPVALAGAYVRVASSPATTCPTGWADPRAYGDGSDPGCTACACGAATGTCSPGVI